MKYIINSPAIGNTETGISSNFLISNAVSENNPKLISAKNQRTCFSFIAVLIHLLLLRTTINIAYYFSIKKQGIINKLKTPAFDAGVFTKRLFQILMAFSLNKVVNYT
ncbi:hypothetical protein KJ854_05730, partial [Patescibacteria group bacterium]|nr:hypothetical protein [Patescibacteria group bacterium]